MAVEGYVAVRLCSIRDLVRLLDAAGWEASESSWPIPELDALLKQLRATVNAASATDLDAIYLIGKAEW